MVEGETRGMTVIVIEMRCVATEIMAETETETVTETAAAIDEARVENDSESLRRGEMIHLLRRRGEVVEEGRLGPMYHHLRLPRHRQCLDRMKDGDRDLEVDVELHLCKDHVEEATAGVTKAEKTQVAAAAVEVEKTTCHQESTHEAKKALRMAVVEAEGGVHGWQVRARGLGEDHDYTSS
jgi:hypothetical protein